MAQEPKLHNNIEKPMRTSKVDHGRFGTGNTADPYTHGRFGGVAGGSISDKTVASAFPMRPTKAGRKRH